jgi:adenosine deaminase
LRVTAHCDVDQENTLGHIRTVLTDLKVDRIDHGGNILQSPNWLPSRAGGVSFTVCPTFSGTLRMGKPHLSMWCEGCSTPG